MGQEKRGLGSLAGAFVELFTLYYPKFLTFLSNLSDIVLSIVRTVIVTIGIPVVLVFIMQVEQPRVAHGIAFFDTDLSLAGKAAWVLVILNAVLEFLVVYVEDREGYNHPVSYRFSLKLLLARLRYFFWYPADPEQRSPAKQYEGVLRIVTYSILFLALMGSMRQEFELYTQERWYEALVKVVTESNLKTFMTWVSSTVFAFTLVMSAQALSRYVAIYTTHLIREMGDKSQSLQAQREKRLALQTRGFDTQTTDPRVIRVSATSVKANCPDCSFTNTYTDVTQAQAGLRSHAPYCKKTRLNS